MIQNDKQLHHALDQLERMYRALATLRAEVLPLNTQQFALMAEGPLDEMRRLEEQIDSYLETCRAPRSKKRNLSHPSRLSPHQANP